MRARNIYRSRLRKKERFVARRRLYFDSLLIQRIVDTHVHVPRHVNPEARFCCTLRGPAFSDGPSDIDGSELTRLYSIFVSTARDGRVPVNSTISRVKSAPVSGGASAIHARARLGLYRAFRCCALLNKFAAANHSSPKTQLPRKYSCAYEGEYFFYFLLRWESKPLDSVIKILHSTLSLSLYYLLTNYIGKLRIVPDFAENSPRILYVSSPAPRLMGTISEPRLRWAVLHLCVVHVTRHYYPDLERDRYKSNVLDMAAR